MYCVSIIRLYQSLLRLTPFDISNSTKQMQKKKKKKKMSILSIELLSH